MELYGVVDGCKVVLCIVIMFDDDFVNMDDLDDDEIDDVFVVFLDI